MKKILRARCSIAPMMSVVSFSLLFRIASRPFRRFLSANGKTVLFTVIGLSIFTVSCNRNKYEVVERNQREVPNFMVAGTHDEVHYVLLHDGHKIYTTCDVSDVSNLDPDARCGFRPLRTYECVLGNVSAEKGTGPLSDLKCTDDDGHNVYLYVEKKE